MVRRYVGPCGGPRRERRQVGPPSPVPQLQLQEGAPEPMTCRWCGTAITQKTRGRPRLYCSVACTNRWWRAHQSAEDRAQVRVKERARARLKPPRSEPVVTYEPCAYCARQIPASNMARSARRFCSQACRERERNQRPRTCACGWTFTARSRHTKACEWCRRGAMGPLPTIKVGPSRKVRTPKAKAVGYVHRGTLPRPCVQCGVDMAPVGKWKHAICAVCRAATAKRTRRLAKARRKGRMVDAVRYRPTDIFERDGWRCHLCGKKVRAVPVPHPQAPTIDHLIPLSDGGRDAPDNVATAHFICNSRRGARGIAQLRLVA